MYHFFNTVPRSTLPRCTHTYTYLIHMYVCSTYDMCMYTHISIFHKPGDCLGNSNNNNNDRASALSG